jgi:alpha-ketoglutarate-dependent taurine dioxygenase
MVSWVLATFTPDEASLIASLIDTHRALSDLSGRFGSQAYAAEELVASPIGSMSPAASLQCRFHWQKNSIAFWDNRSAQHRALFDYFPNRSYGHRVTICGDKPFYKA